MLHAIQIAWLKHHIERLSICWETANTVWKFSNKQMFEKSCKWGIQMIDSCSLGLPSGIVPQKFYIYIQVNLVSLSRNIVYFVVMIALWYAPTHPDRWREAYVCLSIYCMYVYNFMYIIKTCFINAPFFSWALVDCSKTVPNRHFIVVLLADVEIFRSKRQSPIMYSKEELNGEEM